MIVFLEPLFAFILLGSAGITTVENLGFSLTTGTLAEGNIGVYIYPLEEPVVFVELIEPDWRTWEITGSTDIYTGSVETGVGISTGVIDGGVYALTTLPDTTIGVVELTGIELGSGTFTCGT